MIAYPTDSCYALGCQLGNADGMNEDPVDPQLTTGTTSRWCARTSRS